MLLSLYELLLRAGTGEGEGESEGAVRPGEVDGLAAAKAEVLLFRCLDPFADC